MTDHFNCLEELLKSVLDEMFEPYDSIKIISLQVRIDNFHQKPEVYAEIKLKIKGINDTFYLPRLNYWNTKQLINHIKKDLSKHYGPSIFN